MQLAMSLTMIKFNSLHACVDIVFACMAATAIPNSHVKDFFFLLAAPSVFMKL